MKRERGKKTSSTLEPNEAGASARGTRGSGAARGGSPIPNLSEGLPNTADVQIMVGRMTARAFDIQVPLLVRVLEPMKFFAISDLFDELTRNFQRARARHDGRSGEVLPNFDDGKLRDALDVVHNARMLWTAISGMKAVGGAATRLGTLANLNDSFSPFVDKRLDTLKLILDEIPYPKMIDVVLRAYCAPVSTQFGAADYPQFSIFTHPDLIGRRLERPTDWADIIDSAIQSVIDLETSLEAMKRYQGKLNIPEAGPLMPLRAWNASTERTSMEVLAHMNAQYMVPTFETSPTTGAVLSVYGASMPSRVVDHRRTYALWNFDFKPWMKLFADTTVGLVHNNTTQHPTILWENRRYDNPSYTTWYNSWTGGTFSEIPIHNVLSLENDNVIRTIDPLSSYGGARSANHALRIHLAMPHMSTHVDWTTREVTQNYGLTALLGVQQATRMGPPDVEATIFTESRSDTEVAFREMIRLSTQLEINI
jgi:hypothetical protein